MRHSVSINLTRCHFSLALIILIIDVLHACTVNSETLRYKKQSQLIMWNLGYVTIMLQPSHRIIWFSYQLNYCLSLAGHCFTERSSEQVRRHPNTTRSLNSHAFQWDIGETSLTTVSWNAALVDKRRVFQSHFNLSIALPFCMTRFQGFGNDFAIRRMRGLGI